MYHPHREQDKKALIPRLKRIEGQIRGVRRLIDEDAPCESVAQQFSAARRVLDKAFHFLAGCLIESRLGATETRLRDHAGTLSFAPSPSASVDLSDWRNAPKVDWRRS